MFKAREGSATGILVKVAILIASGRPGWSTRRLYHALKERGHHVAYVDVRDLILLVDGGVSLKAGRTPFNPDAVVVRSLGASITLEQFLARLTMLEALEELGVLVVNPWRGILVARSKMLSTLLFRRAGLHVPRSMLTESMGAAVRFADEEGRVVVKPLSGSLGLGSFLVKDPDQMYHVASLFLEAGRPVYSQRYVERAGGGDIRAFVVGGRVVAAAERLPPPGDWKTNIARGGRPRPTRLTPEEEEAAVRAAEALGLLYAGVDMARGVDGHLYIFEANAMPNWRGLYEATGIDPAGEIARLLEALVKRGGEE